MSSNNYAIYGKRFSLEGTFRVLRMTDSRSEPPLDYEEVECATKANSSGLRALIAKANYLRIADFGNGLLGLYAECDDSHFCAVREHTQPGVTEEEREFHSEHLDGEDIF
jgi:hypothetical protein